MADLHHFYVGTSKADVENAGMNDPEYQFSLDEGQHDNSCSISL